MRINPITTPGTSIVKTILSLMSASVPSTATIMIPVPRTRSSVDNTSAILPGGVLGGDSDVPSTTRRSGGFFCFMPIGRPLCGRFRFPELHLEVGLDGLGELELYFFYAERLGDRF